MDKSQEERGLAMEAISDGKRESFGLYFVSVFR